MNETYLIQRLCAPRPKTGSMLDKAHRVFGGGMMQMSEKAWDLFDEFCTIDYMGAAEFEFGALPNSLQDFAKDADELIEFEFVIKGKDVEPGWWRRSKKHVDPEPVKDTTVYVVCRKDHKADVKKVIKKVAKNKQRLKEGSRMPDALDPEPGRDNDVLGWYELNNGFFFTIDKNMLEGFKGIFMQDAA